MSMAFERRGGMTGCFLWAKRTMGLGAIARTENEREPALREGEILGE